MRYDTVSTLKQIAWATLLTLGAAAANADVDASIKLKAAAGGGAEIDPPIAGLIENGSTPIDGVLKLTVICGANIPCTNVTAKLGGVADLSSTAGPNGERVFSVDGTTLRNGGQKLQLLYAAKPVKSFDLVPAAAGAAKPQDPQASTDSIQDLLSCDPDGVTLADYKPYDAKKNEAWFVMTPLGTMIDGPNGADGDVIDENDTVYVTFFVNPKLKDHLRVKRTSAARTLGGFSVAGNDTPPLQRFSTVPCEPYTIYLRDFAPGTAAVKISAQLGDKEVETGTFDFSVSGLYRGMLSFGALRSDRLNDSFILAPNAGQNVIGAGSEGDKENAYAVWYTGFIWGRRDLEKPDLEWYHHINPSIGFGTSHPGENVMLGLTVDWNGFLFHIGKHYAREKVLSSASGLSVGDPFTGTPEQIPTAKHWTSSTYLAVSIDIRAAASLLKAAIGSATK